MRPLAASGLDAALARILHLDPATVPPCPAGHPDPAAHWRGWLGGRALGLVPVPDPSRFSWAGPWLAILPGDRPADPARAAVAFGVPAGLLWIDGLGAPDRADGDTSRRLLDGALAGFVVAPLVTADWSPPATPIAQPGHVAGLAIAPAAAGPMQRVDSVEAEAGLGLIGDRYHGGAGTFSAPGATGTALTLVDAAMLAAVAAPLGPLDLAASRRNVATAGVDLDALIGREFLIGEVRCLGRRRAEPCAHLERLTAPGTLRALVHRAGLRADILTSGTIRIGDAVRIA